jgi:hydroxyethylthiazole kinase-like uncharacterized protein yjeF
VSAPEVVTTELLRGWTLPDADGGGKQSRGSVLVVGGAVDTPGAVMLAGLAALRVGAGRLTMATTAPTAVALAVAVPEAAVTGLPVTGDGAIDPAGAQLVRPLIERADAVVIGPGMRGPVETKGLLEALLPDLADGERLLLLDAMALTCGAVDRELCGAMRRGVVGTPNVTEAGFLLDCEPDQVDDATAGRLADRLGAVIALRSRIAAPDGDSWVDGSGTSGLGTSGSGDVLAGAIAGLAARGAAPDQSAVWGVHVHAQAGERLAARVGKVGFLARELLDELPRVLAELAG